MAAAPDPNVLLPLASTAANLSVPLDIRLPGTEKLLAPTWDALLSTRVIIQGARGNRPIFVDWRAMPILPCSAPTLAALMQQGLDSVFGHRCVMDVPVFMAMVRLFNLLASIPRGYEITPIVAAINQLAIWLNRIPGQLMALGEWSPDQNAWLISEQTWKTIVLARLQEVVNLFVGPGGLLKPIVQADAASSSDGMPEYKTSRDRPAPAAVIASTKVQQQLSEILHLLLCDFPGFLELRGLSSEMYARVADARTRVSADAAAAAGAGARVSAPPAAAAGAGPRVSADAGDPFSVRLRELVEQLLLQDPDSANLIAKFAADPHRQAIARLYYSEPNTLTWSRFEKILTMSQDSVDFAFSAEDFSSPDALQCLQKDPSLYYKALYSTFTPPAANISCYKLATNFFGECFFPIVGPLSLLHSKAVPIITLGLLHEPQEMGKRLATNPHLCRWVEHVLLTNPALWQQLIERFCAVEERNITGVANVASLFLNILRCLPDSPLSAKIRSIESMPAVLGRLWDSNVTDEHQDIYEDLHAAIRGGRDPSSAATAGAFADAMRGPPIEVPSGKGCTLS